MAFRHLFIGLLWAALTATHSAAHADPADKDTVLVDPESVRLGEGLFAKNCVYCHGHQGSGGKAKTLQGREFDADYLFKTISNGRRRGSLVMPPWKRSLSEEQRWQLVAFILSLGEPRKE